MTYTGADAKDVRWIQVARVRLFSYFAKGANTVVQDLPATALPQIGNLAVGNSNDVYLDGEIKYKPDNSIAGKSQFYYDPSFKMVNQGLGDVTDPAGKSWIADDPNVAEGYLGNNAIKTYFDTEIKASIQKDPTLTEVGRAVFVEYLAVAVNATNNKFIGYVNWDSYAASAVKGGTITDGKKTFVADGKSHHLLGNTGIGTDSTGLFKKVRDDINALLKLKNHAEINW
jgi:hypothetical protein